VRSVLPLSLTSRLHLVPLAVYSRNVLVGVMCSWAFVGAAPPASLLHSTTGRQAGGHSRHLKVLLLHVCIACAYVGVRVCACVCVCVRARAEIASVSEHAHIDDHARPHHPSLHARIRPQIKLYFFFSSSSAAAAAAAAAVDHTRMNDECEIYGEMRICSQIWCAAEYGRESSLHISSG